MRVSAAPFMNPHPSVRIFSDGVLTPCSCGASGRKQSMNALRNSSHAFTYVRDEFDVARLKGENWNRGREA